MSNGRWIQAPPIQPGWYWYQDKQSSIGPHVLHVDTLAQANGAFCECVEIEKLPGEWWSELLTPPVS